MLLRVRSQQIMLREVYRPGPRNLSPAEAEELNAARARTIKSRIEQKFPSGVEMTLEKINELQGYAKELDAEFEIGMGLRKRKRVETAPFHRELQELAKLEAQVQINRSGAALSEEEFAHAVDRLMELPELREAAKRRVEAQQEVAKEALAQVLGIGEP